MEFPWGSDGYATARSNYGVWQIDQLEAFSLFQLIQIIKVHALSLAFDMPLWNTVSQGSLFPVPLGKGNADAGDEFAFEPNGPSGQSLSRFL